MPHVVILGAGTAGTIVANKLRAAYAPEDLAVTIVDADDAHHYQPGYLFLPFGIYTEPQIVRSRHHFIPDGVDMVLAEIDRVDADARVVHLADGRTLAYDTLIVATGVQPRPDLTPGADGPDVHHFYDLPAALRLREALRRLRRGRIVVHITDLPIKCPVAPLEFTFLLDAWLTDKKIRPRFEIAYVTPLDGAFTKPVASRELGAMLAERGVALETDFLVERVDNDANELVSFDDRRVPFDLLVSIPLNLGPDYVARSGLGDDANLVPCDQHTMRSLDHPDIFVLGDGGTLQTSKAGSVAHFAVEIFMANFPHYLAGEELPHRFDGHANCFIESGHGKGLLLDFNYGTEPYTGSFPLPGVGPMTLLKESRANHLAKLAFRPVYWELLLRGRPLPFTANMYLMGKRVEGQASGTSTRDLVGGLVRGLFPAKRAEPPPRTPSPRPSPSPAARPTPRPAAPAATDPALVVPDPSPVLAEPIVPRF